jgi:hypothetical protein
MPGWVRRNPQQMLCVLFSTFMSRMRRRQLILPCKVLRLPRPLPLPGRKPRLSQLEARLKLSHHGRCPRSLWHGARRPRRHVSRVACHPGILLLRNWRRRCFLLSSLTHWLAPCLGPLSTRWMLFLGSRDLLGLVRGLMLGLRPIPVQSLSGPATSAHIPVDDPVIELLLDKDRAGFLTICHPYGRHSSVCQH